MKPPLLSYREVVAAFRRAGYEVAGQRGSHIKLLHPTTQVTLIIPAHPEVDRWTLKNILKAADLSVEELMRLL